VRYNERHQTAEEADFFMSLEFAPTDPHALAHAHLRADPVMAAIIARVGELPPLEASPEPFATLVRSVIGQQLSVRAAASIAERVRGVAPDLALEQLAAQSVETLRSLGLSGAKVRTIQALSEAVLGGRLDFGRLTALDDEAVIEALLPLPGIGRWTAEMFLMFALARPDVFAWGDLGLRRGLEASYPDASHPLTVAAWAPQRSLAARYLWRSLNNAPA
jgi:DNA-3-methyladenine glycosylase II